MEIREAILHLQAARLMLLGRDNQPISDLYYALEMAISALEKQEAKKPIIHDMSPLCEAVYNCPSCNAQVNDNVFCWFCGQRIDWSGNGSS